MIELVRGCHKRTGLTETILIIIILTLPYSTVSIGIPQGFQESVWFIQKFLLTVFVLSGLWPGAISRGFLFLIFASYPQPFFLCSSVSEALFALSFSFLCERFFFVHAKAALEYSRNE